MSESAEFLYKTTDYYNPAPTAASAGTTRNWPSTGGWQPPLSDKDKVGLPLAEAELLP
jgi:dTDP-4-dehydrorhamnose 3,5-epimerase